MSAPASRTPHSPLQTVLRDVHATLGELLLAADEQYTAAAAGDHHRLEAITGRQERLAAQLERFERQRLALLAGRPLQQAIAELPRHEAQQASTLNSQIGQAVRELQRRHARSASLLRRSAELANQTLEFVQRLVCADPQAYGRAGRRRPAGSLLVDSRA
jgi:flagellar biosynthesis/type III secretory pathway chaperone